MWRSTVLARWPRRRLDVGRAGRVRQRRCLADDQQFLRLGGMSATLEADDLYRFFHSDDEETFALRGISLQVDAGELVAVTGPSGSGKSTLLACLAGLDDPDGGVVRIEGERLSRRTERARAEIRSRSSGVLYQSSN